MILLPIFTGLFSNLIIKIMFHKLLGSFVLLHAWQCTNIYIFSLFWPGKMERRVNQDSGVLHSNPDSGILALRPWASPLTSLSFSFLLCNMQIIITALWSHKVEWSIKKNKRFGDDRWKALLFSAPPMRVFPLSTPSPIFTFRPWFHILKGGSWEHLLDEHWKEKEKGDPFGWFMTSPVLLCKLRRQRLGLFILLCVVHQGHGRPSIFVGWMNKRNYWVPVLPHRIR